MTATTWNDQTLVFNYYFPTYGDVFTGSPISFVADGSSHLSTLANLSPATFSVSLIAPDEEQISYSYPSQSSPFSLTASSFNGFAIAGPANDAPIYSAVVDAGSTVTGLTNAQLGFSSDLVSVNLSGDTYQPGAIGLVDVFFAVPEPSTVALLAAGLVVVVTSKWLRRSA